MYFICNLWYPVFILLSVFGCTTLFVISSPFSSPFAFSGDGPRAPSSLLSIYFCPLIVFSFLLVLFFFLFLSLLLIPSIPFFSFFILLSRILFCILFQYSFLICDRTMRVVLFLFFLNINIISNRCNNYDNDLKSNNRRIMNCPNV